MNRTITTILMLLIAFHVQAQKQITATADIDKATIFLNGAQLFHSARVNLPAGPSEVIIQGISSMLDANSVQGGGGGNFTIMDIQYRLFYPEPVTGNADLTAIDKKIRLTQDSIVEVDYQIKALLAEKEVLDVQKSILMNNKLLHSTTSDSLELIRNSVVYYEQKMQELLGAALQVERKMYKFNILRGEISARLGQLQQYRNQQAVAVSPNAPIPQVVMQVMAEEATTATVNVDYITYQAGWYATYDIRATDVAKPVELAYKANIWQSTGIDWKNVELTCSTGNPMMGNTLPELTTWYLAYYQQYYERDDKVPQAARAEDLQLDGYTVTAKSKQGTSAAMAGNSAQYTTVQPTLTNVEFNIKLKYNIPSDGKGHIVALQSKTLPTIFNYLVVPKIEQSAFLIARITDWEAINLLPGHANLYFNNSYVGKTYINPLTLSDTLSLSMGRDKSIEVKRELLADKSTERLIGTNNKKTLSYKIEVRNSKPITVEVIIKDHIPVSQQDDIKVEVLDKTGGELDDLTGIITWREKIKTKEKKAFNLAFEVTYPKNTPLSLY